jgi:ABC-type multidrug transport system fused ATPase/permease subunit
VLKAFKLLNQDHKKIFFLLIFLIVLLSFTEVLGFYILQPIISFFSNSQFHFNINFFKILPKDIYQNLKFLLFLFFFIFIIRCCLILSIGMFRSKLCKNINDYLSNQMYSNYLNQDYSFFIGSNSSKLISNIILEVEKFSYRVVDAIIIILTELFVVTAILLFLLSNYFNASVILILAISIIFFIFYKLYKFKFKKLGEAKIFYDSEKVNNLQQSFYAIQNIKLDNLEKFFSKEFEKNNKAASDSYYLLQFFAEIPKPLIEFSVLLIIFLIIFVSYYYLNFSKNEILVMIGLYGIAMFRLLPSCNRILNCVNQVRYYFPNIEKIYNEICYIKVTNIKQEPLDNFSFKDSLVFNNVTFSYPDTKKNILENINLKIKKNEMIGIAGSSGSGKSTLLNLLTYLLKPNSGSIFVDSKPIEKVYVSFRKKIGYVPQKIYLTDESLIKNIIFGQDIKDYNYNSFWDCIERSNLMELVKNLPDKENTIIGERGSKLSGGQQQRVGIARALYKKPDIIIFDEATSGLDKKSEKEILETISNLKDKVTVIIVSHNFDVLDCCQRIIKIENGKLL